MHNITFDFMGQHRHGPAFHEYLRLRKLCFVDLLGWDIPHNDDVEMDQYDNPCSHYSLAVNRGKVVGGARVMPTTATWGSHTYMLRDALRGRLDDIPAHMMASDIATGDVWECTRLVTADSVATHAERAECLSTVIGGVIDIVTEYGGSEVVSLTRPPLARALRQLGFPVSQHGDPYVNESDGHKYAVLRMPAMRMSRMIAAE